MYPKIKTKNILRLACPEFATQLIIVGASMIEMFYVAKLSVIALAALSIGNIIVMMINNFLGEVEAGARVLSAKFAGAEDYNSLTKTFWISIFVPALLGCFVVLFRGVIGLGAFYLIGDGSLNQLGMCYLSTIFISIPFALIFFSLNGFIAGLGDTLSPFFVRVIMHLFQICLEYVLIFGFFGFPRLGVQGVAVAMIFTYFIGALMCVFIITHKKIINYKACFELIKSEFGNKFSIAKDYLNLSFDVGMQFGLSDVAMYLFVMIIGWQGVNVVAVHQIAYYQMYLSLQLPLYCFYLASSVIIGQAIGEQKFLWIIPATNKILNLAMILSIAMSSLVFLFSYEISHIFSPLDAGVAYSASIAIKILCIDSIIETFYIVVSGGLLGACESRFLMESGLAVEFLLLLPMCYIFSWSLGLGIVGACLAMCIRSIINCLIIGWRFFGARKWDNSGITFRVRKTFSIVPGTKESSVYEKRSLVFIMNDFLEEGVMMPVKFFEKNIS